MLFAIAAIQKGGFIGAHVRRVSSIFGPPRGINERAAVAWTVVGGLIDGRAKLPKSGHGGTP